MKKNIFYSVLILFTIHCSLFTAYSQSWQELMDSSNFYWELQDYQYALLWAEKALPQAEKEFGEKDTNYIASLNSIYYCYYYMGRAEKAIEFCEKLKQIIKEVKGVESSEYGNVIGNLGAIYQGIGNFEKAEPLFKESLELRRRLFKKDHPDLATSINNMAFFYFGRGRYAEAEPLLIEALEMCKHLFKADHNDLALYMNNLAIFYEDRGRYSEAEPLLIEALEMYRRLLTGDHRDLALTINNMAYFYEGRGRYAEAEPLYKEALEMKRRIYKEDNSDLALSINNMASFSNGRGRYAEAEPLYKEALEMYRRIFKGDHPDLAMSILNIAYFYNNIGNFEQSEPLFKEALEMYRRIFKSDHPNLMKSIGCMGILYNCKGDFNQAEPMFKEALEMSRRMFKGDHPDLATSINNMASFFIDKGDYMKAEPLYKESLEMSRRIFKGDHPDLATGINNMAMFYNTRRDYKKSELLYFELIKVCSNLMKNYFPSLSEKEKEQFYNTFSKYYLFFNNFVVSRYEKSPKLLETLFDNQLLNKGMLLSSSNKVRISIMSSNDTSLIKTFSRWKDKKEDIAKLYLLSKAQLDKKNINLDSIIITANDLEKELTKRSEVFRQEYDKKKLYWKDVQNSLGKDEAVLEIGRLNHIEKSKTTDTIYYAALILKKNSKLPELVLFKNGNDLESKYIKNYKRSILKQIEDKESYTQFWEPIAKKLKGIKRVYISPDGVYNQINLATLLNPKTEHFLSDDIDIRVVTSTRDLVERHTPESFLKRGKQPPESPFDKGEQVVELFGDPMYNLDSSKHLELASAIAENRTREFYYLGNTLDSTTRGGIRPLPSTRTEIEQIANEFTKKGWKVNSHLGEKALEEAVKGVDNPKVLHIATHGKFLKDIDVKDDDRMLGMETKRVVENPLLRSFLLFSGAENTLNNQKLDNQNTDDGLLTAYEAMNLNLDKTDLVVLSACETGLGEIKNGEGVYGLQRAFQQAGAKSIIMSLWTVPDKETQELMTSFYSKWLNGKDKRTAFNEARNEMRDKYHYPYYWGGFVMVGE